MLNDRHSCHDYCQIRLEVNVPAILRYDTLNMRSPVAQLAAVSRGVVVEYHVTHAN